MRYIPIDTESREEITTRDGSVFRVGDEVTVVAEKNLNDDVVTGILTGIVGNYVYVYVYEYTLVVRCSSVLGSKARDNEINS